MEFNTLNDLKDYFIAGEFNFPDEFIVAGAKFKYLTSTNYNIRDMIASNKKAAMIYSTTPEGLKSNTDNTLDRRILFLWGFTPNHRMVPYDVRTMSAAQNSADIKEGTEDNFIGSSVEVQITNFNGQRLKGKVDTGADICSLHAERWKIEGRNVSFICPELSNNMIVAPLVDNQAVKSADGGTEYRPVIELNVKINGRLIQNVMFNLNDRGKMSYPILIGKNALQAGKFKIDPSMDESADVDWTIVQEMSNNDVVLKDNYATQTIIHWLQANINNI